MAASLVFRKRIKEMSKYIKSGLQIKANKFFGAMNPSLSQDLNIIEAVWDHLDRERNKRQPISKEELWDVLQ